MVPDLNPCAVASFEGMNVATRSQQLLTPSKVTAWLDCAHFLILQHEVDDGLRNIPSGALGEFARLLMAKGLEHERDCLAAYEADGKDVYRVADRDRHESFASFVDRTGDVLSLGHEIVYQMPFVHDGMRGIADFLVRVDLPEGGFTYEPVDAKLARNEAKPGHVLQLCFYADAIEAQLGVAPDYVHLWLGSGRMESIRLADVRAYWRRLRRQLQVALEPQRDAAATKPVKCAHCTFCAFADVCDAEWRSADALQFVANIRTADTAVLEAGGVMTMAALAECVLPVDGLEPERQTRLITQASLQVKARQTPDALPPFEVIEVGTPEELAAALGALPAPDDGDVFLDYEGHPFWRADRGLFFLFGLLTKKADGQWEYEARWAHGLDEEGARTKELIEYLAARRLAHEGMHVYHYNHTERTSLERLAADHGADQAALQALIQTGLFVDLFQVVRHSVIAGIESYGLKNMERFATYERSHEIDAGAGAVVEYERYLHEHEQGLLDRIAAYNEDDVRATLALRDWLIELRDEPMAWRAAMIELAEKEATEVDEQIAALHEFPAESAEHLMGDLLGYWIREGKANTAQLIAKLGKDPDELRGDPEAIADLDFVAVAARMGVRKPLKWPGAEFHFGDQPICAKLHPGERPPSVCYRATEGMAGWATVDTLDTENGRLGLIWNERAQELGIHPTAVVLNDWVSARPKPEALAELAASLLDGTASASAAMAILCAAPPAFVDGRGPLGGVFNDDVDDVTRWVLHLERSCVPIQGPPGTGKTWMGAQIVHALVQAGKRVGITAMSHHAIDNLLAEVLKVFTQHGDLALLRAVRKDPKEATPDSRNVTLTTDKDKAADFCFNVVAGTTWLFAGKAMRAAPVDVLIIDEAGQLGLADALAASRSTENVVLLGDPLQLSQVSQASHPNGSGASVLQHILGDGIATVATDRGVFLTETRRMHPDVCRFISEQIYEGRLGWYESCERQGTEHGTGLRWLQAHHAGCSTESTEEADLVVQEVSSLLGSRWTDADGIDHVLTAGDIMVVAPYNDQVRLLRQTFEDNPEFAGIRVGTVDKFQGQQAPVVFFTMTTSTADDMPRDSEFLFSRNRLNVALSRARCLAYVVCTDALLNSRARSLEEMRLISTLCAAVDYATR